MLKSRDVWDVSYLAFKIALRRRFEFGTDASVVSDYATQALKRRDEDWFLLRAGDMQVRNAELLMRGELDGRSWHEDIRHRTGVGYIALALLADLTDPRRMAPQEVDELVASAETRARNVRRRRDGKVNDVGHEGLWVRSGVPDAIRATSSADSRQPESAVAFWFKAAAVGIHPAAVTSYPADNVNNMAVADAVFDLGVRPRFNQECLDRHISAWALKVNKYVPEVSREIVEATIRKYYFKQDGDGDKVDDDDEYLIRMIMVPTLLVETGMFDREMDELLVAAEGLARERGYQPELARVPRDDQG